MNIRRDKDHYSVKSSSSNRWYEVYPDRPFCSCPNFVFRSVKGSGVCKHLVAVREHVGTSNPDIVDFVRAKGEVNSIELIEHYGEAEVNSLIERGELVEKAGRIRVLE